MNVLVRVPPVRACNGAERGPDGGGAERVPGRGRGGRYGRRRGAPDAGGDARAVGGRQQLGGPHGAQHAQARQARALHAAAHGARHSARHAAAAPRPRRLLARQDLGTTYVLHARLRVSLTRPRSKLVVLGQIVPQRSKLPRHCYTRDKGRAPNRQLPSRNDGIVTAITMFYGHYFE